MKDYTDSFYRGLDKLSSEFDYEDFGKCLMFLGKFPHLLSFKIDDVDIRIALKLRHRMMMCGYIDSRLKETIIYHEGMKILKKYSK